MLNVILILGGIIMSIAINLFTIKFDTLRYMYKMCISCLNIWRALCKTGSNMGFFQILFFANRRICVEYGCEPFFASLSNMTPSIWHPFFYVIITYSSNYCSIYCEKHLELPFVIHGL